MESLELSVAHIKAIELRPSVGRKRPGQTLKMRKKLKHSLYKLLNRSGLRFILTAWAAIIATIRVGKLCKVSYEGEWVQRFPSCTLVEPRLTLYTPKQIEGMTSYYFMYQYLPEREIRSWTSVRVPDGRHCCFRGAWVGPVASYR